MAITYKLNPFTGKFDAVSVDAPGGSDTQVQFNDGGVFAGDSGMVFNKTTNALTLTGTITASVATTTDIALVLKTTDDNTTKNLFAALKSDDTVMASIGATGAALFQNGTDSTTGFQILDSDGGTPIFNVDTTNERVGIGTATPEVALDVKSTGGSMLTLERTAGQANRWDFQITNSGGGENGSLRLYPKDSSVKLSFSANTDGAADFQIDSSGYCYAVNRIRIGSTSEVPGAGIDTSGFPTSLVHLRFTGVPSQTADFMQARNSDSATQFAIDKDGKLALGHGSPGAPLHAKGTAMEMRFEDTDTTLTTDQTTGEISVYHNDASVNGTGHKAGIRFYSPESTGNQAAIGFMTTNHQSTSPTEWMTLAADGRLGVGVKSTSSNSKLTVYHDNNGGTAVNTYGLAIETDQASANTGGGILFTRTGQSNYWRIKGENAGGTHYFHISNYTGSTMNQWLTITHANGKTGFNDTSPDAQIDVVSQASTIITAIFQAAGSQSANIVEARDSSSNVGFAIEPDFDVVIGSAAADKDYTLTFKGETNSGILTWMEDEDYFKFGDDILMDDGENIELTNALGTDHTACGKTTTDTVGENVVFGNVLYMKSDGKYWESDADAAGTMPVTVMALATIAADASGVLLHQGYVRDDTWAWTIGGLIYASTTVNALTQTAPSGTGDQVQVVGYAVTADIMYFNPSLVLVEVA